MANSRTFYISGNEDNKYISHLIENLLFHKREKGKNPLLINLEDKAYYFTPQKKDKKNPNRYGKLFNYCTSQEIAVLPFEKLYTVLKNKNTKLKLLEIEKDFSSIFITGDISAENIKLYSMIDNIVLVVKNNKEASSYLYNYIRYLKDKLIDKNIYIIISNIKEIEEAVSIFLNLKKEMKEIFSVEEISINFIAPFFIDSPKIIFSKKINKIVIEAFPDDGFMGNIKYITEQIEKIKNVYKEESFFTQLSSTETKFTF